MGFGGEYGNSRAARRTALVSGYGAVESSSWRVWSTIWGLTPRPWERRMLRKG